jgi:cation transporter-like permease
MIALSTSPHTGYYTQGISRAKPKTSRAQCCLVYGFLSSCTVDLHCKFVQSITEGGKAANTLLLPETPALGFKLALQRMICLALKGVAWLFSSIKGGNPIPTLLATYNIAGENVTQRRHARSGKGRKKDVQQIKK